jgi:hypothetical protein
MEYVRFDSVSALYLPPETILSVSTKVDCKDVSALESNIMTQDEEPVAWRPIIPLIDRHGAVIQPCSNFASFREMDLMSNTMLLFRYLVCEVRTDFFV